MLELGEERAEVLGQLASQFLVQEAKLRRELKDLKEHVWPEIQRIGEAIFRVSKFCKCILFLLNQDFPSECKDDGASSIAHVLWFTQYTGKLVFEKAVRQALTADASYFNTLIQDVMKTAASSKALEPKLIDLRKLLRKDDMRLTFEDIMSCLGLLEEVKNGMRRGAVESEEKDFLGKLFAMGKVLLETPGACDVSNAYVKALLKGLGTFEEKPGVMDMLKTIEKFMTSNASTMASNDLTSFLEGVIKSRELGLGQLSTLVKQCDRSDISTTLLNKMDEYLLEIAQWVSGQARWF